MPTRKKITILIADDSPDDQYLFQTALIELYPNIHFNFVYNGFQLVNYLTDKVAHVVKGHKPDIIITDVQMPFVSGVEALKTIRTSAECCAIPVYVFSNSGEKRTECEAMTHGAKRFYTKPSSFVALKAMLSAILLDSCGIVAVL